MPYLFGACLEALRILRDFEGYFGDIPRPQELQVFRKFENFGLVDFLLRVWSVAFGSAPAVRVKGGRSSFSDCRPKKIPRGIGTTGKLFRGSFGWRPSTETASLRTRWFAAVTSYQVWRVVDDSFVSSWRGLYRNGVCSSFETFRRCRTIGMIGNFNMASYLTWSMYIVHVPTCTSWYIVQPWSACMYKVGAVCESVALQLRM